MRYDYLEAVKNDIVNYIQENINLSEYTREDLEEKLNEDLWTCDSVTGNASGSYTFNREEAKNNLAGNGDLVREAFEEFGEKDQLIEWFFDENFELIDVTVRCYLLGQAIAEVLEDIEESEFIQA